MKKLIVNADDFGYTWGVNKGIIEAYKKGIVTSASLMVNGPAAADAAQLAKENPRLGVGLHFVFTDEDFKILRTIQKMIGIVFAKRVKKELEAQFERFQKLTGKIPDHIDSHYHLHKLPRIFPYFFEIAQEYKIPLRDAGKIGYIKRFFGMDEITGGEMLGRISIESLLKILGELPEETSELMCHPGYTTPDLRGQYLKQREIELRTLIDTQVKDFIKKSGIELITFTQLRVKRICQGRE